VSENGVIMRRNEEEFESLVIEGLERERER